MLIQINSLENVVVVFSSVQVQVSTLSLCADELWLWLLDQRLDSVRCLRLVTRVRAALFGVVVVVGIFSVVLGEYVRDVLFVFFINTRWLRRAVIGLGASELMPYISCGIFWPKLSERPDSVASIDVRVIQKPFHMVFRVVVGLLSH